MAKLSFVETSKCGLPQIPPLDELPFIEDCAVPEWVDAIQDCPDIDLPLPANAGGSGVDGVPGAHGPVGPPGVDNEVQGPDGAAGPDGEDGCEPIVYATVSVTVAHTAGSAGVTVSVSSLGFCRYRLHFTFTFYEDPDDQNCCQWVWCCDAGGDPCCPGHWVKMSGSDSCEEPCTSGCCHGQLKIICRDRCSSSSSSSESSSSSSSESSSSESSSSESSSESSSSSSSSSSQSSGEPQCPEFCTEEDEVQISFSGVVAKDPAGTCDFCDLWNSTTFAFFPFPSFTVERDGCCVGNTLDLYPEGFEDPCDTVQAEVCYMADKVRFTLSSLDGGVMVFEVAKTAPYNCRDIGALTFKPELSGPGPAYTSQCAWEDVVVTIG